MASSEKDQKKKIKAASKEKSASSNTSDTENTLGQYLKDISKIKHLTKAEECGLSKLIQNGNVKAMQELVRRNLKYVVSVANKFKSCGLSLQDLIEEGNIGLIQAAKRFDGSRDIKFITYASWWIRQAIMHALAEQSGTVKLPVKQASNLYKIGKRHESLSQYLEREPTKAEIAEVMDLDLEQVESIMRVYKTHFSLDTPLNENDKTPYVDLLESPNYIPYDDQIFISSLKEKTNEMLKELLPREEAILRMRFGFGGDPMTLESIGKAIGLSRERVRQIEERAKKKLLQKTRQDFNAEDIS
jgi:RNA polymerase primary sigma factor